MSTGGWSGFKALFQEALDLPEEERAAFLERIRGEKPDLANRVESLLQAHEKAGDFLEKPIRDKVAELLLNRDLQELEKDLEGRFRFVKVLGEGGMGYVLLAEQLRPVRRLVALKLMKPGTADPDTLARFEDERQALALMNHPHIAQIYEAGASRTGRPYFVMEHVKGLPINLHRELQDLSIPETLALFEELCHAVQHAHQKGIVHRDLKPSNVLVSDAFELPSPKVIDFGIARPTRLNSKVNDFALEPAKVMGTLPYMSPEQVDPERGDIDTRCDIYALGVLLYQLLTGRLPLEAPTRQALILKILLETPPLASRKISANGKGKKVRGHPASHGAILAKQTRGDLDAILAKALHKDPERRYDSASALAEDLERYRFDRPVAARAPTPVYRLLKFFRRHQRLTSATLGLAAILASTMLASLMGLNRALQGQRQARDLLAATRGEQIQAVTDFQALDHALKALPDPVPLASLTTLDVLNLARGRTGSTGAQEPRISAKLLEDIARACKRLGAKDKR